MNYTTLIEWTGKSLRTVPVEIESWHGIPFKVRYAGDIYRPTGKLGRNRWTGEAVREWSTREETPGNDFRIWTNEDVSKVGDD